MVSESFVGFHDLYFEFCSGCFYDFPEIFEPLCGGEMLGLENDFVFPVVNLVTRA
jgi:hypothetical protein